MFRITRDPGSINLHFTEIKYNGSQLLVTCVDGVWRHILDLVCVCVCVYVVSGLRDTLKYPAVTCSPSVSGHILP